MTITLSNAALVAIPYAPYVAAAVGTVALIALVYFAYKNMNSSVLKQDSPPTRHAPAPTTPATAPAPTSAPTSARAQPPSELFKDKLGEVNRSPTPQKVVAQLENHFADAIKHAISHEQVAELIRVFISSARQTAYGLDDPRDSSRWPRPLVQQTAKLLVDVWIDEHVNPKALSDLLKLEFVQLHEPALKMLRKAADNGSPAPAREPYARALVEIGIEGSEALLQTIVRARFESSNDIDEKTALYTELDNPTHEDMITLTALWMKARNESPVLASLPEGIASKLQAGAKLCHELYSITEKDLSLEAIVHGADATQFRRDRVNPFIKIIKNKPRDQDKTALLKEMIQMICSPAYVELCRHEQIKEALALPLGKLSVKLDDFYSSGRQLFNLAEAGAMDNVIYAHLWISALSYAVGQGIREFKLEMDTAGDAAAAAAVASQGGVLNATGNAISAEDLAAISRALSEN